MAVPSKTSSMIRFNCCCWCFKSDEKIRRLIELLSRWILSFSINHPISWIQTPNVQQQLISYLLRIVRQENLINSLIDLKACDTEKKTAFCRLLFVSRQAQCDNHSVTVYAVAPKNIHSISSVVSVLCMCYDEFAMAQPENRRKKKEK